MYPLKKAFRWIFLITLIVSGIPWGAFIAYTYVLQIREKDPKYAIVAIAQSTKAQESLKSAYLAELLHLSIDCPKNLYTFDLGEAKNKLLAFPCLKEAHVMRIPPEIIAVDYVLRKPVAFLADFSNTALDSEGFAFPFHPFYSPKKLPSLFLGVDEVKWGGKVDSTLAFQVLECAEEPLEIDVSQAASSSLGDQKIIVRFEGHDVLLDPIHFKEGLDRYKKWKRGLKEDKALTMIDLRLPNLGFIQKEKDE